MAKIYSVMPDNGLINLGLQGALDTGVTEADYIPYANKFLRDVIFADNRNPGFLLLHF